ncbi:Acyltransferase family protein [Maioricimonas rarisocia]|uniref:Acyltransferase family protein n=1 Tax=Maioricimonas rarisocia TaxID=2528026 RepID=A0A517Z0Z6_9PLAN|nr:acyltransferase [Maioricimonas rarisocia]QDU36135.1 Acyltransferase family protein [Maioricimonas rarisocia]
MSTSRPRRRLDELEGLRGIAALVVVFSHLRHTFFENASQAIRFRYGDTAETLFKACIDGTCAVWIFWVMSAFVLSLKFHASSPGDHLNTMLRDATFKRYPRLMLPILASVCLAWALHAGDLMTNQDLAEILGPEYDAWLGSFYTFAPSPSHAFQSAVWHALFDYRAEDSYNAVLWTMEIEFYGSLFLFAFLALFGKHALRLFVYALTLAVVSALGAHWISSFILGTALCDVYVHRQMLTERFSPRIRLFTAAARNSKLLAIAVLATLWYAIGLPNRWGVMNLILATFVTGFVVFSSPASRFFALSPFVFLGKISFGLYLVHLAIICSAAYPLFNAFHPVVGRHQAAIAASLCLLALSIAGGWCLWFVADRPAVSLARAVSDTFERPLRDNQKTAEVAHQPDANRVTATDVSRQ